MVHQELNMIQDCIKRMASNSFMLKGWYVSLVFLGASILSGKNTSLLNPVYVLFMLLVLTIIFWGLDGFFLKMETLYRWKYEWVIKERIKGNVLCFYDLNPYNSSQWINPIDKAGKTCIFIYIWSKTLKPLYLPGVILPLGFFAYKILKCFY